MQPWTLGNHLPSMGRAEGWSQSIRDEADLQRTLRVEECSKCTDTPMASQRLGRHACPTRYVSETASCVVHEQLPNTNTAHDSVGPALHRNLYAA